MVLANIKRNYKSLLSETHLTDKSNLIIPGYKIYDTKHADRKYREGSRILIKDRAKHYVKEHFAKHYI